MKLLITTIAAASLLLVPASASAQEAQPEPTPYQYPLCADDPDVSCYTPYGEEHPAATYESGQYPAGWYEARYNEAGEANEYRHTELRGSTSTESVVYDNSMSTTPEPTPTVDAEVKVAAAHIEKTDDERFMEMMGEWLNWKI